MADSYWDKVTTSRISRRRMLQSTGVAGAAASAVWLVGCGGSSDDSKKTPGATTTGATAQATSGASKTEPDVLNEKNPAVAGGRYLVSNTASFDTFDPHLGIASSTAYFPRLYNVLLQQSPTRPEFTFFDLAESFETPDPLTWNFKIRKGVKVAQNTLGVPERDLNGDDVVATFDRIKNEPKANNGAFVKQNVTSVTTTGDTVTIKTKDPYAWFLNRVGLFVNTIPPKELIANQASIDKMRNKSAGAGPYVLTSSTEGEGATLERNKNYFGKDSKNGNAQLPYIDGFDIKLITDRAAERAAFQNAQLLSYQPANKGEADELAKNSLFYQAKGPSFTFISLTMHPEKDPFKDNRVRKAFSMAINRDEYVQRVYQGDAKPNGLVHWPLGSYAFSGDELTKRQPYDVAEAKKLVTAVGGIKVKMIYPAASNIEEHDKHLPIFLEQMKAAGIEIEQDPQDFPTWLENYRTLNYTLSLSLNQVYETPEVPLDFHSKGGPLTDRSYVVGLNLPEIDTAIEFSKKQTEFEARKKAVLDAQDLIYAKDPAFLPFVSPVTYVLYNKKVRNLPDGVGSTAGLLNTAWIEA